MTFILVYLFWELQTLFGVHLMHQVSSARNIPAQPLNPMFPTSQPPQQQYMGGPSGFTVPSQKPTYQQQPYGFVGNQAPYQWLPAFESQPTNSFYRYAKITRFFAFDK
jgi:hypothetical protein